LAGKLVLSFWLGIKPLDHETENSHRFKFTGKEEEKETGWIDFGARMYDAQLGRWHVSDALAEEAPDWTPYRYAFNNPINYIDPDGNWEFKITTTEEGEDAKQQLSLVKTSKKDNWKAFRKESGLSKKEIAGMFGDNYEEALNAESIGVSSMQGETSAMLQEMETAMLEYNQKDDLSGNNCMGVCNSLASTGKIDENSTLGSGPIKTKEFDFETRLAEDYNNVSSPKIGDVARYSIDGGETTRHTATVLLKNKDGVQVFYKNNGGVGSEYFIKSESDMRAEVNYGKCLGLVKTRPNSEGEAIKYNESGFYRIKESAKQ